MLDCHHEATYLLLQRSKETRLVRDKKLEKPPRILLEELNRFGFDLSALDRFRTLREDATILTPSELLPGDITRLPPLGTPERQSLTQRGLASLRGRQTGVVILAGGNATRFGGVVKAAMPVLDGRTFLQLTLAMIRALEARAEVEIPVYLLTSLATHAALEAHCQELGPLTLVPQFASLRLTPSGDFFKEDSGAFSPYATGHGDLAAALKRSGELDRFAARGGRRLVVANVDNLGATVDPAMLALHADLGGEITLEVVRREAGDQGGAVARVDGRIQVVEAFRMPADFPQARLTAFSTNTFIIETAALARDIPLPYHRVEKTVDGRTAVQFERLLGEMTEFATTRLVEVERNGRDARFLPVKVPEELPTRIDTIRAVVDQNCTPIPSSGPTDTPTAAGKIKRL